MPLPAPGVGSMGLGEKLFLARGARRGRGEGDVGHALGLDHRRAAVVDDGGAADERDDLAGQLLGLGSVVGGLEAVVGGDQRELAAAHPARVVDHVEVRLDAVHAGLAEARDEAADLAHVADLDLRRRHARCWWPCPGAHAAGPPSRHRSCRRSCRRWSPPVVPPCAAGGRRRPWRRRRVDHLAAVGDRPAVGDPAGGAGPRWTTPAPAPRRSAGTRRRRWPPGPPATTTADTDLRSCMRR